MALVANYGSSSGESDDEAGPSSVVVRSSSGSVSLTNDDNEIEEFVKKIDYGQDAPLPPKPVMPTTTSSLSKMKLPSVKKGKVKITIPSLQSIDSDSDEDTAPTEKKSTSATGLLGMLGNLPAPRNTFGGKETGRALIPRKKPPPPPLKATTKKTKSNTARSRKPAENNSDSDEDVSQPSSSGNFFSLDASETKTGPSVATVSRSVPKPLTLKTPVNPVTDAYANAPLAFNNAGSSATSSMYNLASGVNAVPGYSGVDNSTYMYNTAVPGEYDDTYEQHAHGIEEAQPPSNDDDGIQDMLKDEQFLRLQGRKRKGREEINIIDVHSDDQKISDLEISKNISAEVPSSSYAHRKSGGPSGQQKRKHQITYLAYQAKERELDLKNQWADNKFSKMQTRAKYGF